MNNYLKITIFIIIGLIIGYFSTTNLPFLKDGRIKDLEISNTKLQSEINNRDKNITELNTTFVDLKLHEISLQKQIDNRSIYINDLETRIDSINKIIYNTDTIITKTKNKYYEEINGVNNWDINQRVGFFSNYFTQNQ